MKRWLKRGVTLLCGVGVIAAIVYGFLPKPVSADIERIETGPLQISVTEDGKTRLKDRYIVSAPLAGRLLRVELEPGDEVEARQTIVAEFEPDLPPVLDERTRKQAVAKQNTADLQLKKVTLSEATAKIALETAETQLKRIKDLVPSRTATQEELELAELEVARRKEEYASSKLAVQIAQFELEWAKMALLELDNLSTPVSPGEQRTMILKAPISGRVLRRFQESATVVAPGTQILEIGDPQRIELEVDVLSTDAVKIRPHAKVIIEHWGGEEPLTGEVRLVEPSGFTKVSALGVEEQRVNVISDILDSPEERPTLGDAYRIEAKIILWESADVLKVPTSALFRHGTDWATFKLVDGKAQRQILKIGHRNGFAAEVLEGLAQGDQVIVHPSDQVADGVEIVARK